MSLRPTERDRLRGIALRAESDKALARAGAALARQQAARIAELEAEITALRQLAPGSCAGCFTAGQHIEALHEIISHAAPEGWAATGDITAANEWAKLAVEIMAKGPAK